MKNKEKGMTFELKESTLNTQFLSLEIHDKTRVLTLLPGTYLNGTRSALYSDVIKAYITYPQKFTGMYQRRV